MPVLPAGLRRRAVCGKLKAEKRRREYAEQITDIARFMLYLLEEKSRLFAAIRKAKDALDMDMDSEVSLNAARQSIARTFKRMNDLRSSEQLLSGGGTGYRFNAEGNQTRPPTGWTSAL